MSVVYIAGPMTGLPYNNYPAFDTAADALRAAGHVPVNPARHGGRGEAEGWSWTDYMRHSIRDLTMADAIHLLPGWESSRGARLEARIADQLGLERIDLNTNQEGTK